MAALRAGASAEEAAAVARIAGGQAGPADSTVLQAAQAEISTALRALQRVRPAGDLAESSIASVRRQLEAGAAALLPPAAHATQAAGAGPASPRAAPARASLLEFLADNSIQLLAYSGAFLLAVAVLLFDLSGASPARFWAVAGLNAAFAAGGWFAFRRPALRVVAVAYVALAALLLPLTGLAAYVFLKLGPLGVNASLAAAMIASACALAYTVLAVLLGSRAYAVLSICALGVAAGAGTDAANQTPWIGASLAALSPVLASVAASASRRRHVYALPAEAGTYVAGVIGVLWTVAAADARHWPLTAALLLVSAAAIIRAGLHWRRLDLAWMAVTTLPAAAISLGDSLALDIVWQRSLMLAMALGAVLLAWAFAPPLSPGNRDYLRAVATVLVLVASVFAGSSDWIQVGVLSSATAVGILLTLTARQSGWLWLPSATFTYAWYWLVKVAVPPPPAPEPADLARVYAPLGLLLMGCALAARVVRGRVWAWPLYGAAALVAAGSTAIALLANAWQLAGLWTLVYAALIYAAGVVERWGWAVGTAVTAGVGGVALLLLAAGAGPSAQVLALGGAGLATYAAGVASGLSPRLRFAGAIQQALGVALALLAALAGVAALGSSPVEVMAGAASAAAAAIALAAGGLLHRQPLGQYGAPVAASLLGVYAARTAQHVGLALGDQLILQVLLPAVVLAWTGVRAGADTRLPARIALARTATAAGALLLFGATAALAWGGSPASVDPRHTGWLAIEGAAGLAAAVYGRSRALALCAAVALGVAALLSAFLLARATSLSVTFGVLAVALISVATLLAMFRGRLSRGPGFTRSAWERWT